MAEKIKITQKEINELYEVIKDIPDAEVEIDNANRPNATFEEFTEYFDEKQLKEKKNG